MGFRDTWVCATVSRTRAMAAELDPGGSSLSSGALPWEEGTVVVRITGKCEVKRVVRLAASLEPLVGSETNGRSSIKTS